MEEGFIKLAFPFIPGSVHRLLYQRWTVTVICGSDLATGKREPGLRACVYEVRARQPEAEVWVEAPRGSTELQL
jgi:hypothetical protein